MKLAIHNSTKGFHPYWVDYCQSHNIPFKIVDCYATDIIKQLEDCYVLFWHHHHNGTKDILIAKQLLFALEHTGFKVFPDFKTGWHFDDKVAQKFLFERIGAPLVPTYIFLNKNDALQWIKTQSFPKILKLRGGAGSKNVKLVKSNQEAVKLCNKAFGSGISNYDALESINERWRNYKRGTGNLKSVLVGIARLLIKPNFVKVKGKDFGYVYFQDFIPELDRDYRTKIFEDKCWGYQRLVREGDFRASGSGSDSYVYTDDAIPEEILKLTFEIANKLSLQSAAFDFLISNEKIFLIEVSCFYGFNDLQHHGYWDRNLKFHKGQFNPFGWMIESARKE